MGNRDKAHRLISGKGPEGRLIHGHVGGNVPRDFPQLRQIPVFLKGDGPQLPHAVHISPAFLHRLTALERVQTVRVKIFGIQMFISNFHDVVYTSQTKNRFETYDLV